MSFFGKAWKMAGRSLKGPSRKLKKTARGLRKAIHKTSKGIGKTLGKVPIVGKPLKGIYNLAASPIRMTADLTTGVRPDKAMMRNLKREVKVIKDNAGYIRAVLPMIPGVGSTLAAGLSAGLALAQGKPITTALLEAAKGAVPGGALAQTSFGVAVNAAMGKAVNNKAIKSLTDLSPKQKKMLSGAMKVVSNSARGKKPNAAAKKLLAQAGKQLPAKYTKSLQMGLAMGAGANAQKALPKAIKKSALKSFNKRGRSIIGKSNILKAGMRTLTKNQRTGFAVGTAIMRRKLTPVQLNSIRKRMGKKRVVGFDMALAVNIGKIATAVAKAKRTKSKPILSLERRKAAAKRRLANRKTASKRRTTTRRVTAKRRTTRSSQLSAKMRARQLKTSAKLKARRANRRAKSKKRSLAIAQKKFGYLVATGLKGTKSEKLKATILQPLAHSGAALAGVKAAVKAPDALKPTFWKRVITWLTATG